MDLSILEIFQGINDNADKIRQQANAGNDKARNLVGVYKMVMSYPEQAAITFLTCAYEDWLNT